MNLRDLSDDELRALLAQAKKKPRELDAKDRAMMDPTAGQSWWENAAAGLGKAGFDTVRGVGQLLGMVSREEMDEVKKRDAALMDSSGGFWGNMAGNAALALAGGPAASIPKAATVGAGMGFIQPVGTDDSRVMNTAMGGMFGAAVPAGVAAVRGAKAVAEPIVAPNRTAARIVEQFADDPQAMRLAAQQAAEILPNSRPTLAQVAMQPGISTLERSMANQPGPLQKALSDRMFEQNAARAGAMKELAGEGGKLDYHKAARSAVAEELYAKAMAEVPGDTKWIKGEITKLMQRPSFVAALKDAQELAMDSGIKVSPKNPENATQLLHFTKQALDDKIEAAVRAGNGNKSKALIDTRDKLVSLMESKDFSPSYREARDTFKQMSGPINEMELAAELRGKLVPAAQDGLDAPANLNFGNFSQAMRARGDEIARVMSPEGKKTLEQVFQDLQRAKRAEGMGKPTGSPTAQYLTTQNLMRQVAGPIGLPQGVADKAVGAVMGTPVVGGAMRWANKGAEARVQDELAKMLMDPRTASQAFALINQQPGTMKRLAGGAVPYLPALAVSGMFANR